jgi:drug/metabolite transporter (DMT)-like permease
MPLLVAISAAAFLHEAFTTTKMVGFALILPGVFGIAGGRGGITGSQETICHALFLGPGLAWACYTVAMRRARLDRLHAAAIAAVGALILYVPVYFFVGRAVSILGASSGAAFAALVPAMTALMAIPMLGEWPSAIDWMAIISISVGVYVLSAGPLLPERRGRTQSGQQ